MFESPTYLQKLRVVLPENPVRMIIFLVLSIVGLGSFFYGLYGALSQSTTEITQIDEFAGTICEPSVSTQMLTVYISGAVAQAGVYHLPLDSRILDLVAAAGNFTEDSDQVFIHKTLNLAEKLSDGQRLYIPSSNESEYALALAELKKQNVSSSTLISEDGGAASTTALVAINTATSKELQTLRGIGESRAEAIIAARPFSAIEELLARELIPESVFLEIRDRLSL